MATSEMTHNEHGHAIVTGAASGIGRATATALLDEGWSVIAADRDGAALKGLRQDLADSQALSIYSIDLSEIKEIERFVKELPEAMEIRGLVCCAAQGDNTEFMDVTEDRLRSIFELNFFATFALCQNVARRMVRSGGGSIVNITSTSGLRANAGRSAYGSSKAAVELLSKIMAVELAPYSVRVNTVAPGPTLTKMAENLHAGPEQQRLLNKVPQGRYGTPKEIAEGIVYLLDNNRSSFVTGHTLCVDGGMYAAGSFEPTR